MDLEETILFTVQNKKRIILARIEQHSYECCFCNTLREKMHDFHRGIIDHF